MASGGAILQHVGRALVGGPRALVALTVRGVADRGTGLHRCPGRAPVIALLQAEVAGAGTLVGHGHANQRRIALVRARVATRAAASGVVDEAGLVRAAELRVIAFALALSGAASVASVRARVAAGGAAIGTVDEAGFVRTADLRIVALALVLAYRAGVATIGARVATWVAAIGVVDEAGLVRTADLQGVAIALVLA